jgi:hypothetical protein
MTYFPTIFIFNLKINTLMSINFAHLFILQRLLALIILFKNIVYLEVILQFSLMQTMETSGEIQSIGIFANPWASGRFIGAHTGLGPSEHAIFFVMAPDSTCLSIVQGFH